MHLNNVGPLWLRRYAVFVACCTFVLVIAGGLVTSNDAALSVPDWPLSYGRLIPTLEGGIRYEFAHRALAFCHDWRDIGWRHPAPGRLKDLRDEHLTYSALALAFSADC